MTKLVVVLCPIRHISTEMGVGIVGRRKTTSFRVISFHYHYETDIILIFFFTRTRVFK